MISPSSSSSRSSSSERADNQASSASGKTPHITDTRSTYALLSSSGGASSSGQRIVDEAGEESSIFSGKPGHKGKKKRQASDLAYEHRQSSRFVNPPPSYSAEGTSSGGAILDDTGEETSIFSGMPGNKGKKKRKISNISYEHSEKGKATRAAYKRSEKGKALQASYNSSEKGKATREAYRKSERGKAMEAARKPKIKESRLKYGDKNRDITNWAKENGWPEFRVTILTNPKRYPDGKALAANVRAAYEAAHIHSPIVRASQTESSLGLSPSASSGAIPSDQSPNVASASQAYIADTFDDQLGLDIANLLTDVAAPANTPAGSATQPGPSSILPPSPASGAMPADQRSDIASAAQADTVDALGDLLDIDVTEASLTNVAHAFDGLVDIENLPGYQETPSSQANLPQAGLRASVDDLLSLDIDNLAADEATRSSPPTVSTSQAAPHSTLASSSASGAAPSDQNPEATNRSPDTFDDILDFDIENLPEIVLSDEDS